MDGRLLCETLVSRISQARERAEESSKAMCKQERRSQRAFRTWDLLPLELKAPDGLMWGTPSDCEPLRGI